MTKKSKLPAGAPDPSGVPTGRVTGLPDLPGTNAPILVKDPLNDGVTPQPKIIAAGTAGAITTLIVWAISAIGNVDVPPEVAAAFTALIAAAAGYFTSNK